MSLQTPHARPRSPRHAVGAVGQRPAGRRRLVVGPAWRWLLGALALIIAATVLVLWAKVRPGYDPYGWLVWGRLTLHGQLDTNGAPSWKPLPYLFTLPFALFGRHALYLWMITAFAISLSGVVFAWRVAFHLVAAPAERRYAAYLAGLVAALSVLGIQDYLHSILSAESDTIVVALCLAAVDCILNRRYRWAFWVWWLAALGRPEVWAPMGLYVLWAWRAQPRLRRDMVAGVILVPLLWFGIPGLTSHSPFSPATLAERSPRELHSNKITGTIGRFEALSPIQFKLAALLAVAVAAWRRDRATLLLAGGVVLWVVVEVAFALHGWSAVPRYMYEAAAATGVLAGVFLGRAVLDTGPALASLSRRGPLRRLPLASPALAGWVAAAVVAVFAVSAVPAARGRIKAESLDLNGQRVRTSYIAQLATVVQHLTPARILACGQPNIGIGWQSILAWQLGTNTGVLYFSAKYEQDHPHPVVNMYPHSYGWDFFPSDWTSAVQAARCRGLSYRT